MLSSFDSRFVFQLRSYCPPDEQLLGFPRPCRAERSILVDEDKVTIGDIDDHVELAVAAHIQGGEGHYGQVLSLADQGRAEVDFGLRGIPSWELDHLDMTVEVDSNEMAGVAGGVGMSDHPVDLVGPRTAVVPVILGHLPPRGEQAQDDPAQKHGAEGQPEKEQPMGAMRPSRRRGQEGWLSRLLYAESTTARRDGVTRGERGSSPYRGGDWAGPGATPARPHPGRRPPRRQEPGAGMAVSVGGGSSWSYEHLLVLSGSSPFRGEKGRPVLLLALPDRWVSHRPADHLKRAGDRPSSSGHRHREGERGDQDELVLRLFPSGARRRDEGHLQGEPQFPPAAVEDLDRLRGHQGTPQVFDHESWARCLHESADEGAVTLLPAGAATQQ